VRVSNLTSRNFLGIDEKSHSIMTFTEYYEKFCTSVVKCGKTHIPIYLSCVAFSKYSVLKEKSDQTLSNFKNASHLLYLTKVSLCPVSSHAEGD
jgi:hypothetical protein